MKLTELLGIKKHSSLSLEDLIKAFQEESGYKKLGNGHFAYAFKHPSKDEVLKLWIADSAYEDFLKFCESHKSEKNLPKIYKFGKLSTFHRRLYGFPEKIMYVRMELLRPLNLNDVGDISNDCPPLSKLIVQLSALHKRGHKFSLYGNKSVDQSAWTKINLYWKDGKIPQKIIDMYSTLEKFKFTDHDLDLHDENIMVRPSTGDLVISDPIANDDDIKTMHNLIHDAPSVDDVDPKYTKSGKDKTK
jgi:hypothetical protein